MRPLELPDFETQARRLRYQALGAACRTENISNLLLAHHADDQAETALMRLSSGYSSIGVRGMHSLADIPECWGIHGVHRSGEYEATFRYEERKSSETGKILRSTPVIGSDQRSIDSRLFEYGGVQVLRPLLEFRKQDLIDTCQAHGVAWSEDPTNKDTWRTTRNATRSLLCSSRLPMALETTSLIQLSTQMKARETRHNTCAIRLYELSDIQLFDLRSGVLLVRLPKQPVTETITIDAAQSRPSMPSPLIASMLIRRLVRLVTPYEDASLHSLERAVTALFPSLARPNDIQQQIKSSSFTTAGVMFERIDSPMPDSDSTSAGREGRNEDLDTNFIWRLSRRPYRKLSTNDEHRRMQNAPITILIDGALPRRRGASYSPLWSSWKLWDGRYWMRIKNETGQPLKVRPFHVSDLQAIYLSISKSMRKVFKEVLATAAPNKIRWTLPVIAHAGEEDGKLGKVLALPTLGKIGMIDIEDEHGQRIVEWEVKYKMVDLGRNQDGTRRSIDMIKSWEDF